MISHMLRQMAPNYDCTYEYTVNYLAGNTPLSVQPEFFVQGNAEMLQRYSGTLPGFDRRQSFEPEVFMASIARPTRAKVLYGLANSIVHGSNAS